MNLKFQEISHINLQIQELGYCSNREHLMAYG